ncbi:MAG TPA: lipocalin family protein [Chryseosolibacter sp.]
MLTRKILVAGLMAASLMACDKKNDSSSANSTGQGTETNAAASNDQLIAGNSEKTWKAKRETNSEGDKDKLTKAEKEQRITFWRNGNVKMGDETQTLDGKWSYSGSTLTLQFTGENVTENFTVIELDDDEMKLRAADGSEMTMKPE